ncbi:hypothetical protein MSG28_002493 [Choristoneura fumiferana]|uniref:Uncharacterized protein n=1 Tax=Choristoneura fumiferana TaxID=7141 RepID=A0ACC0JVP1_CHOFU|nr:hypothetical protein MSG28_002493 [Choristoneura fumiferana]
MFSKIAVLALLVVAAQSSAIHGGNYNSFSYGVSDPHTGDVKSQHETRVGDTVRGQYSLLESDGTKRTVDYAADAHSGFNAVVRKDPALLAHAAPRTPRTWLTPLPWPTPPTPLPSRTPRTLTAPSPLPSPTAPSPTALTVLVLDTATVSVTDTDSATLMVLASDTLVCITTENPPQLSTYFVVVLALAVASQASVVPVPLARADDYSSFAYDVADPNTGDYKSQVETRSGGVVQGQYSLLDADGTKRTVDYAADDVNGFNAVVRKDPVAFAAPVVSAPVVAAAPAVVAARTVSAPAVYSAAPAVYSAAAPTVYSAAAPVAYTASGPAVVAARTVAAPAVYSAAAPAVYSVASRTVAAPAVYAASAPVVSTRTVAAPAVYTASAPVYARTYAAPSIYTGSYYAGTPYTYGAYAAPVAYTAHGATVSQW